MMERTPSDHCQEPVPRNVRGHPNIGLSEDVNCTIFGVHHGCKVY